MDIEDQAFRRRMIWLLPPPLPLPFSRQQALLAAHRETNKEIQLADRRCGFVGEGTGMESNHTTGEKAWYSVIH
jgi:hypothetical protein